MRRVCDVLRSGTRRGVMISFLKRDKRETESDHNLVTNGKKEKSDAEKKKKKTTVRALISATQPPPCRGRAAAAGVPLRRGIAVPRSATRRDRKLPSAGDTNALPDGIHARLTLVAEGQRAEICIIGGLCVFLFLFQ